MKLIGDLFLQSGVQHDAGQIKSLLEINKMHAILQGHFPGFPVMPGVCMMQAVKEIFELAFNVSVRITHGDNMKFLSVLEPARNPLIEVTIQYTRSEIGYAINAMITSAGATGAESPQTFFKFRGTYQLMLNEA